MDETLLRKPIFLVGYMGCGKSTLGRKLAHHLCCRMVDTDRMVENNEGASVADVFHYEGETYFREVERKALEESIQKTQRVVVSTGGGLPVWKDNMVWMNHVGMTIFLRRSATQIASRMSPYGRQKRPRLRGLSDEELVAFMEKDMQERNPFYEQAAYCLDCDQRSDQEIVDEIIERLIPDYGMKIVEQNK